MDQVPRHYDDWYSWALTQFDNDPRRASRAARAAIEALGIGAQADIARLAAFSAAAAQTPTWAPIEMPLTVEDLQTPPEPTPRPSDPSGATLPGSAVMARGSGTPRRGIEPTGRISGSRVLALAGVVVALLGVGFLLGTQAWRIRLFDPLVVLGALTVAALAAGLSGIIPTSSDAGRRARIALLSLACVAAGGLGGDVAYGAIAPGNPGCGAAPDSASCTRVLFVGNSYTFVNDLPGMFAILANSGGHRVETGMVAEGGSSLADHVAAPATATKLRTRRWDLVVLQEQSQVPSVGRLREDQMYPAARRLVQMIRDAGAQPMFFLTWARRDGWPENGLVDYGGMQSAIDDAYLAIAGEQHAAVAPVGFAWSSLLGKEALPDLWQDDGSHPTAKGTYLAACVFYATVFRQSPKGLMYRADLSVDEAARVQTIAAEVVLGDPSKWGLL